jgi:hypothetical protein
MGRETSWGDSERVSPRHLPLALVGDTDDGDVDDRRMSEEEAFELRRGDLHSVDLDELLDTVDDEEKVVLVNLDLVTSAEPSFVVKSLLRRLLVGEIYEGEWSDLASSEDA